MTKSTLIYSFLFIVLLSSCNRDETHTCESIPNDHPVMEFSQLTEDKDTLWFVNADNEVLTLVESERYFSPDYKITCGGGLLQDDCECVSTFSHRYKSVDDEWELIFITDINPQPEETFSTTDPLSLFIVIQESRETGGGSAGFDQEFVGEYSIRWEDDTYFVRMEETSSWEPVLSDTVILANTNSLFSDAGELMDQSFSLTLVKEKGVYAFEVFDETWTRRD